MRSHRFRRLSRLALGLALPSLFGLCAGPALAVGPDSPPVQELAIQGLADRVSIRRDQRGIPLIETRNFHDAIFTLGYVHASDRLEQMLGMRLLASGKLAETGGAALLPVDRLMRALDFGRQAETLLANASPHLRAALSVYARGVNAYLFRRRGPLPATVVGSGRRPEYWSAKDSALVFCLLGFSLSTNLPEEIAALQLAQKVGSARLPWLIPSYPGEPLPFAEAEKLAGLELNGRISGLTELARSSELAGRSLPGIAGAHGWAIAPQMSRHGKSLLAGDLQEQTGPSPWRFVHIRAPGFQAAGISLAGLPLLLSGFNGQLAWSMSPVMADTQDLFLEQLRQKGGRPYYLSGDRWQPLRTRRETFLVRNGKARHETLYATAHGPLLNAIPTDAGYGLALQSFPLDGDRSLDALLQLARAGSLEQAFAAASELRALPLNLVFADAGHIGWQLTGRYPNRRAGSGLLPSPGWDSRYDWDGFADPVLHPYDQDPSQGWLGMAGQRPVPRGYGMQLSNSWQTPGRAERIAVLAGRGGHDARSLAAMQFDRTSSFAARLQAMLEAPGMSQPLHQAIDALPPASAARAREALSRLLSFDGRLDAGSANAALYDAFLRESARQTFLDELGPENDDAWPALLRISGLSYSAQADHLLDREDSPYWDDLGTAQKEDKPAILARSLAAASAYLEHRLGPRRSTWQWRRLHHHGGDAAPPGGDQDTLDRTTYREGPNSHGIQELPLRFLVDFARTDPLQVPDTAANGSLSSEKTYKGIPFRAEDLDGTYGAHRQLLLPIDR